MIAALPLEQSSWLQWTVDQMAVVMRSRGDTHNGHITNNRRVIDNSITSHSIEAYLRKGYRETD